MIFSTQFAKASSVTDCNVESIVKITLLPATASFVMFSPVIVPSTDISTCFCPLVPFKYSSNIDSIPVFPIISSMLYLSFLCWYSSSLIVLVYPITCAANVPLLYTLSAVVSILIPGNSPFLSFICATTVSFTSFEIVIGFVALYPVVVIKYLIEIIFLISSTLSVEIWYLDLNL